MSSATAWSYRILVDGLLADVEGSDRETPRDEDDNTDTDIPF